MKRLGTGAANFAIDFQIKSARTIAFVFDADISSWVFQLFIKRYPGDRLNAISLTYANGGLTYPIYGSNEIDANFTTTNTNIQEGEYYWELRRTDINVPLLSGIAKFSYDAREGDITSSEFSIDILTQTVNVTISSGGGGSSTVTTDDDTIQGDGSTGNKVRLKKAYADGVTITGSGIISDPFVGLGSGLQPAGNLSEVLSIISSRSNIQALHDRKDETSKSSGFTPALADFTGLDLLYKCTASFSITLPSDATQAIPVGRGFYVKTMNGSVTTFAAGSGASLAESTSGGFTSDPGTGSFFMSYVYKSAANTWSLINGSPAVSTTDIIATCTINAVNIALTNMASGAVEFAGAGNTFRYRFWFLGTKYNYARISIGCSLQGATNARAYIEWSTDDSSFTTLGSGSGTDTAQFGSTGTKKSDWLALPSGAKAEVVWRVVLIGGDGAADPVLGTVNVQFKS